MYRLLRFLRNPEGAVGYNMLRLLSKGGPILGAIAAIASSPEVIKDIIQAMGTKGVSGKRRLAQKL